MNYHLSPYNASKAAMNSLCRYVVYFIIVSPNHIDLAAYRTLAQEEEDIVCVALRPGMVDTSVSMLYAHPGIHRDASSTDASNSQVNWCI
jgi:hypothetical protein